MKLTALQLQRPKKITIILKIESEDYYKKEEKVVCIVIKFSKFSMIFFINFVICFIVFNNNLQE